MGSNQDWIEWGERDPLYGVATFEPERQKGASQEWNIEELHRLGAQDWKVFSDRWHRYGVNPGKCVEIGCGVGRYTKQIAGEFDHVHGFDVSPGMIALAQEHSGGANTEFMVTNGHELPLPSGSVDAVFSAFVFQHFDSPDYGSDYFREIARILKPGGSMMIHLPLHQYPVFSHRLKVLMRAQYKLVNKLGTIRAERERRRKSDSAQSPKFRLISYEFEQLLDELPRYGLGGIESESFMFPSYDERLSVLYARKAGSTHNGEK